jgi:serine/threonine protein kinase
MEPAAQPPYPVGAPGAAAYTKVRKLGQGGMAETFLCVRREPGDPRERKATIEERACCKRLLPHLSANDELRAALLREASIVAALRHSNIAQLKGLDLGTRELYFELVDGVDLRILRADHPERRLPALLVALIGIELCKALAYAHSRTKQGKPMCVIHRDISPSNVMISYAGEVKLCDFGVAAVAELGRRDREPTTRGAVRGKLPYMAPEQARGDIHIDGRADLFSLGVLLYELVVGRRPFDGASDDETYDRIAAGRSEPVRALRPEVPEALGNTIERLIRPNPARRFQSADDTLDALSELALSHNMFRQLGALARRAKAPETVDYAAFDQHETEPPSESLLPTRAVAPEVSVTAGKRATLRLRWLGGSAGLLAAASCLVLGLAPEPNPQSAQSEERAARVPPPRTAMPSRAESAPSETFVSLQTKTEPPVALAPRMEPTQVSASAIEVASAIPTARPENHGTLRVGVVPFAKVWIDGRDLGWSPVTAKLEPDQEHTVTAGDNGAQVIRKVRLTAGEKRSLVLRLREAQ